MDEALIKLAETLDDALRQANAIEAAAPQMGVFGKIYVAFVDTLTLISPTKGQEVYNSIMVDGNSVREALTAVLGHVQPSEPKTALRLMKNGNIWDYSTHVEDMVAWSRKILAEEPDARVEVEYASEEEMYRWKTGE